MWKRFLIAGVLILIVGLLGAVILWERLGKDASVDTLQAVPSDAILYLDRIDMDYLNRSFLREGRIWTDFVHTTEKNRVDSVVNRLLEWTGASEAFRNLFTDKRLALSLHLIGKDQVTPLFYANYTDLHGDKEFEQVVMDMLDQEAMAQERRYEAETVYDISGGPGFVPSRFSFACVRGICLISTSPILVEAAVRTIHSGGSLATKEGLQRVRETAGRFVHANIYVNYGNLRQLFYPVTNPDKRGQLISFSNVASWGELDLDLREDGMILNGMTFAEPDRSRFFHAFRSQEPVKMELHEVMPSGISGFFHMGISASSGFLSDIRTYYAGQEEGPEIEAEISRLADLYGIDPLKDLAEIMEDEMAWFAIAGESESPDEEVTIVEIESPSETAGVIQAWVRGYLQQHTFDMNSLLHFYRLDDQTSFRIYRLPDPFFQGLPPGRIFNEYMALYDHYLLFGPSVDALSRVIYQNILHKTLVSDPAYKEMSGYFSNRSSISVFIRPYPYLDYRREFLRPSAAALLDQSELFLRRIPGLVIQYSSEGELFYQSIGLKYTSQIKEKALTVWESLLDSTAVMKPALVINHNTSENEIFVQDAANKIYLINGTGRILWKQKLEGRILGEIYQVDYYRNGKLQLLFNTPGKLHLIDRNGNYVERYPVTLRSRATNPMALFDYDNNGDYRIFLAGEDRKIYVYDLEGNVVPGWRFNGTESRVSLPAQHFRIGEKDYIVVMDAIRTYILNRRGRERVRLDTRVVVSRNNPVYLDMNIRQEKPRWIASDTSGNVTAIYPDGNVEILLEQELSPGHSFTMRDLDLDGIPEYIFAEGKELTAVQQTGNRLFSYKVREAISSRPDIYKFSARDIKVGITDQVRDRIYLINSDGTLYDGFPLEGSTRFSIGYFAGSGSRFNLIVGSSNNFLYNYSIE